MEYVGSLLRDDITLYDLDVLIINDKEEKDK